jgi:hypothetical protein
MHITAEATLENHHTGERRVVKDIVINVADINDVRWSGGDTGDEFFDAMESDVERLENRIQDQIERIFEDESAVDFSYSLHKCTVEEVARLNR